MGSLKTKLTDFNLKSKGLYTDDQELVDKRKLTKLANEVGLTLDMIFNGHDDRDEEARKLKITDDKGFCLETFDLSKLYDESLFKEFDIVKEKYMGSKYKKLPRSGDSDTGKYLKLETWNLNTILYHYKFQLKKNIRITLTYDMKADNPYTAVTFKKEDDDENYMHVKKTYEYHQEQKEKKLAEINELVEKLYPQVLRPAKKARASLGGALEPVIEEMDTQPL